MRKQELIKKIEKAVENCKKLRLDLDGSDNPQAIETRVRAEAKQVAFESVLLAMRGNAIHLNIEANCIKSTKEGSKEARTFYFDKYADLSLDDFDKRKR